MIHVNLYKYTNKPIIVDKTSYLGTPLSITGDVPANNQDMENPTIYLKNASEYDYNYAYIQEYHRYYYLTNKTWMGGDVWSFTWHVDELYTYRALVHELSGIVEYSNYGQTYKLDKRLNYDVPPVMDIATPDVGGFSPGESMILLRYYTANFDNTALGYDTPPIMMNCVYMSIHAYHYFLEQYLKLFTDNKESLAVAIGSTIIDVSIVRYLDFSASGYTSDRNVVFNSPAVWELNNNSGYTIPCEPIAGTILPNTIVYQVDPYNILGGIGKNYTFNINYGSYWMRTAKRKLNLPYIGSTDIDLSQFGVGADGDCELKISVAHEPAENAYVITPSVNNEVIFTARYATQTTTNLAFPIDTSFQNREQVETMKILNLIAQGATLAGATAMTGIASPFLLNRLVGGITGTMLEMDNLHMQDALSIQYKSVTGGSVDLVFPESYIYLETLYTPPAGNYVMYWADHGRPDGEYRSLANLSGYIKMQDFEMKYASNATKGEMDRLEQQLYNGVIL